MSEGYISYHISQEDNQLTNSSRPCDTYMGQGTGLSLVYVMVCRLLGARLARPILKYHKQFHEDVIKWKRFSLYWPFVRGIYRSLVNSSSQRPVTRSFGGFFDLRLNTRLSKQSRRRWFETLSRSLWRHCNVACWILWGNIIKYWHCISFIPTGTCLGNGILHYKEMQGRFVFLKTNVMVGDEPGHQQP